jgi:hypothetical protein
MLNDLKVAPNAVRFVPSNGAAPAMVDLAAGGVDIVAASLPEARSLIDAGKAVPLVVMANEPAALYPKVPTLKSLTGSTWTNGAWRGIVGPKGLPADVQGKLSASLKKIYDSKEYKDFMSGRGFGVMYADSAEFGKFMDKSDQDMGAILKTLGMASNAWRALPALGARRRRRFFSRIVSMKINDALSGLLVAVCGGALDRLFPPACDGAGYRSQRFPQALAGG